MSSESLFLYHLTLTDEYNNPEKWTPETMTTIQQHANFIDGLGQQGVLAFAGRTLFDPGDEHLFGIAVLKADSLEEAQSIMAPDPSVVAGIQQAQIFPFSLGIRHFGNLQESA